VPSDSLPLDALPLDSIPSPDSGVPVTDPDGAASAEAGVDRD